MSARRKVQVLKRAKTQHISPFDCRHEDEQGPAIGTYGDGIVCLICGMCLTWQELAEYMRGYTEESR